MDVTEGIMEPLILMNRIAQSTRNNLMVDYDCIDVMVSVRLEGKVEWLQELGPIVKQSQDVSDGTIRWCIVINIWKNRKIHSDEKLYVLNFT